MKIFIAFVTKEFKHILRDVRTLLFLVGMPVLLILLFGYAITTEVREVPIAVVDLSKDELSQKTINRLSASEYFDLKVVADDVSEGEVYMRKSIVRMVLVFPLDYAKDANSKVQLLIDATDPNEATQVVEYVKPIIAMTKMGSQPSEGTDLPTIQVDTKLLYNPQMKASYNFVPGVMGLVLMLICAMMTSIAVVREREMGTMEVLLVSPIKPITIILSKAVPYMTVSMLIVVIILLLSSFVLNVPILGSVFLVLLLSVIYSIVALALGLLISTIADSQQSAMLISGMGLMLPVMLLSGMIFPIESMPIFLQVLSNIIPAKWYIIALKDVMIKGLGVEYILQELFILVAMMFVFFAVSIKRFKIRL